MPRVIPDSLGRVSEAIVSGLPRLLMSLALMAAAWPAQADPTRLSAPEYRLERGETGLIAKNFAGTAEPEAAGRPAGKTRLVLELPAGADNFAATITFADFIDPFVAAVGLTGETGALVLDVARNRPLAHAGLMPGDLVISLAGQPVRDAIQVRRMLGPGREGTVEAEVVRFGRGAVDLIAQLRAVAARGNRDATLALGDVSLFNLDGRNDPAAAEEYYLRAFAMGDARAAYRLGMMYAGGMGVAVDLAVATRWYRLSADAGLPAGQHALGLTWWTSRYWTGLALVGDYSEAVRLFRLAADRGHVPSYLYLGLAHQFGYGTERDYAAALGWYQKAAAAGEVDAMVRLAEMAEAGQGSDPDPVHALELYRDAAALGSAEANRRLGEKSWRGEGMPVHPIDAIGYLKAAAEAGDTASMSLIAQILLSGYGVTRDEEGAIEWYFRAYRAGDADAGFALALAYADGIGVPQDASKVAGFMLDAIRRGSRAALAEMKGNAEGWDIAVREDLQRLLQASGFYSGAIDGVFGPGTLRALDAAAGG